MLVKLALASVSVCALLAGTVGPADAAVKVKLEPYVRRRQHAAGDGAAAPGDPRMFIVEQNGRVKDLEGLGKLARAVPRRAQQVSRRPVTTTSTSRGLLGMAFHPKFKDNGKFYVSYSTPTDYRADSARSAGGTTTATSSRNTPCRRRQERGRPRAARRPHCSHRWPQFNHNGHWIGFGPDGMLFVSMGDGGYANDWGIGHNVTYRQRPGHEPPTLGKILRIDPDGNKPGIPPTTRSSATRAPLPRSGPRHAQPVALLVRHGQQQRAVLRRRAAKQLSKR